ncbi:MAG: TIM44-like domain-containing protein [Nitrospirae bacterium]|nr:TIM44-like domain-containing protein [Nitrospirota bacterium]MBI3594934.1 TIM44-like domain-containing protein [Nitrospirota bacterium]
MKKKNAVGCLILMLLFGLIVAESDSFARAGGSKSFGSRGSRTAAPAASPSPTTGSSPAAMGQTPVQPTSQPSPGLFGGGFGRGVMGGLIGGMIGGMLFRSLGFAGDGFGGSGIGLFEVLLIVGIGFGIYTWMKRNSSLSYSSPERGSSSVAIPGSIYQGFPTGSGGVATFKSVGEGLRAILAMDPQFKVENFKNLASDIFFKIQIGWGKRDISYLSKFLTPEMNSIFDREIGRLKAEFKNNHIDNISLRAVEIVEAWQEEGCDYITTLISANLLDYTKSDVSGEIVSGSDIEPVSFNENWTYCRPVGTGNWTLSAIQQV